MWNALYYQILKEFGVSRYVPISFQYSNFTKIRPMGAATCGKTDRRTAIHDEPNSRLSLSVWKRHQSTDNRISLVSICKTAWHSVRTCPQNTQMDRLRRHAPNSTNSCTFRNDARYINRTYGHSSWDEAQNISEKVEKKMNSYRFSSHMCLTL